ncbi:MAG: hypothetical protein ACYCXQ_00925 [Candidatus Humimicrobiaceae bacterium]
MFKKLKILLESKILWERYKRKYMKRKEYRIGGLIPQGSKKMAERPIEFKVEKVYEFKKGGRYFFAITSDKPLNERMISNLKEALKTQGERLFKDLGIISSFIVLEDGLDIKVLPSKEKKKSDDWTDPKIRIQKWYT